MKEKTIKDIIENVRWNWYGEGPESLDEPCYQGKFWDHTTKTFKTWREVQRADEKEDNNTTSC